MTEESHNCMYEHPLVRSDFSTRLNGTCGGYFLLVRCRALIKSQRISLE